MTKLRSPLRSRMLGRTGEVIMASQYQMEAFLRETYRLALRGGGPLERVSRDDLQPHLALTDEDYEDCASQWSEQGPAEPDGVGDMRLTAEGAAHCEARFGRLV